MSQPVAIVAGVSRGIGRATAIRLVCEFSAVVVVARIAEALHKTTTGWRARSVPHLNGAEAVPARKYKRRLFHYSGLSSPIMVGMNSDTVG